MPLPPTRSFLFALVPTLTACGSGEWVVQTWGEDYIESSIPADAFEDGCEAAYESFTVEITEAVLLDGDGEVAADAGAGSFELTEPGPQEVGSAAATATHYDTARFAVAPKGGPSVRATGTLSCGGETVGFDWSFETATTYTCEPADLTVAKGGTAETELTIHGDHFFYDGLEDPDAGLQGLPILTADADADGMVSLEELEAVAVAPLGHTVGQYSEVTDMRAFVTHLSQTLGHVDGEGHCQVAF
jgi:hypothetical protein